MPDPTKINKTITEINGDKNKSLSVKEYLNKIKPYLSDRINALKTKGEWKIELTMEIDFMSSEDSKDIQNSKDFNETSLYTKSNNIEIMIGNEIDEIIE